MKITIDCTGRDNDDLCGLDDEELMGWLLAQAATGQRPPYNISDVNGNTVATVSVDDDSTISKAELAADLRKKQIGLYFTHSSMASLFQYIEQFNGEEKSLAFLIYGLTNNAVLEAVARDLEGEA